MGWLGQRGLTIEDIKELQPSLVRFAPTLARYLVDDQKVRLNVILPHEDEEAFQQAVAEVYGSYSASAAGKAAAEAVSLWIQAHTGKRPRTSARAKSKRRT